MFKDQFLPQYKPVYYAYDPETGNYSKTPQNALKTPVMRLPFELKTEPAILHQIKCNAREIIRGKEKFKSGSFKFFTGMQATDFKQWFSGNDYELMKTGKTLSLCLFHFSNDKTRLTVFYFGRFYKENRAERERFITGIVPHLSNQHLL